jgi:hypothetical protein
MRDYKKFLVWEKSPTNTWRISDHYFLSERWNIWIDKSNEKIIHLQILLKVAVETQKKILPFFAFGSEWIRISIITKHWFKIHW